MEDAFPLPQDVRSQLPLDYLEAYPFPCFIFSQPTSTHFPAAPPTNLPGISTLNPLPLLWHNQRWTSLAAGKTLQETLDPFQLNNLRIWLSESSPSTRKSSSSTDDSNVTTTTLPPSLDTSPPSLFLRLQLPTQLLSMHLIRTVHPPLSATSLATAHADVIIVQTHTTPHAARTHSTSVSRFTDRYAGNRTTTFQPSLMVDGGEVNVSDDSDWTQNGQRVAPPVNAQGGANALTEEHLKDHLAVQGQSIEGGKKAWPFESKSGNLNTPDLSTATSSNATPTISSTQLVVPPPLSPTNVLGRRASFQQLEQRRPSIQLPTTMAIAERVALPVDTEKGSIAYLMETTNWGETGLGPREEWKPWLKAIIGVTMDVPTECCYWHGEDLTMVYNTAYAKMTPIHPYAFGKPGSSSYGDVWKDLRPVLQKVWDGTPVSREEDLWLFDVPDHPHKIETYHRITLVPVTGPSGKTEGIFNTCNEGTAQYLLRRRLLAMREITDRTVHARTQEEFFSAVFDALSLADVARDIPFALLYDVQSDDSLEPVKDNVAMKEYFPIARKASTTKVSLNLVNSVGVPLPHASAPLEMDLEVPRRGHEPAPILHSFDSNTTARTTSPSPSLHSSASGAHHSGSRLQAMPDTIIEECVEKATSWPFLQTLLSKEQMVLIEDCSALSEGYEIRCWDVVPNQAVMLALAEKGNATPMAVMIVGLNIRRPLDDDYKAFLDMLRGTLTSGLSAVRATEGEAMAAENAKKLDRAKESFFSNVAHELKTPLTLIVGPINDLASSVKDPKSKALINLAQRNVLRLSRLVNSLMDFSKLEAGRLRCSFKPVNVGVLTANLAAMWRSAIEGAKMKLEVQCDIDHSPINVFVDVDCWEKIVFNLCSNAFKYSDRGSVISVIVRYTEYTCELLVADTGKGIAIDDLDRVTDRFHRTGRAEESAVEGTGIGLAYVSELVKLHAGHMSIESRVKEESVDGSHGSTFRVTLPLGSEHLDHDQVDTNPFDLSAETFDQGLIDEAIGWEREQDSFSEGNSDIGSGSRDSSGGTSAATRGIDPSTLFFDKAKDVILLVDDNVDMRRYIKSLFQPFVKTVLEARDGQEAFEIATSLAEPPTLILSDVTMPRMSGTQLLSKVRGHEGLAFVPVVLLTAKAGEDDRLDGFLKGADAYLGKPFKARELIATVNVQIQLGKRRTILERDFKLRTAELQAISDYSPTGLVRATLDGALTWANQTWLQQSGIDPGVDSMNDWGIHVNPEDIDQLVADWLGFLGGDCATVTLAWRWRNGKHMSAVFVRLDRVSPGLTGCIGCVTEVTQAKLQEIEQKARLEEEKARRLEAVAARERQSLLVDVTSHELRNPISAVIQCAVLVNQNLQGLRGQIEQHLMGSQSFTPSTEMLSMLNEDIDALESIYECSTAQGRVADDILSLSRVQLDMLEVHHIPTDIKKEAKKVLSIFGTEARKLDIDLSLEFGPGIDRIKGYLSTDPVRLGQVITNLMNNAIRFTQTSEVRRIHIRFDASHEPPIDDSCLMPTPENTPFVPSDSPQPIYLYASFADTGPGLAPQELEKLFRRFSQASSQTHTIFGGSGLGLFVCRQIVELMNGRIEVASTHGMGSEFRFFIAAQTTPPPAEAPSLAKGKLVGLTLEADKARSALKILVVEDNLVNMKVLLRQLKKTGYQAVPAFNGLEGLNLMKEHNYNFDCCLMDLEMPVMDGLTAVKELRRLEKAEGMARNLVIALTGNAREQQKQNALDCGMDAVVIKPYQLASLLEKVESMVLDNKSAREVNLRG